MKSNTKNLPPTWFVRGTANKLWFWSGNGFNSLKSTKFAEDVPLLRNFTAAPGKNPELKGSIKSIPAPSLMSPVICWAGLNNPVNGEFGDMSTVNGHIAPTPWIA